MPKRPAKGTLVMLAGLAAAVLCGPLLLREDRAESARLDSNRQQIERMTEADRRRLERNDQRWSSLSPAEQQAWRRFDEQLRANRVELGPVLEDYYRWLQTVPGYRREELRRATDVNSKVALVHEIVHDQLAARLETPPVEPRFGGASEIPLLSSIELDSVLAVVERHLSEAERERLVDRQGNALTGVERHLLVLMLIRRKFGGPQQLLQNGPLFNELAEALPPRARNALPPVSERGTGQPRRHLVLAIITLSVRAELERAIRDGAPTPDKLRTFYDTQLPPEQQEQLLNLSAREFTEELSRRYFRHELEQRIEIDIAQVQQFLSGREPGRDGPPPGDRPLFDGGVPDRLRPRLDGRDPFVSPRGEPRRPGEGPPPPPERRPERDERPGSAGERRPGERRNDDRGFDDRRPGERPPPREGGSSPPGPPPGPPPQERRTDDF